MLMSRNELHESIKTLRETMDARTDIELLYANVDNHLTAYKAYIAEPGHSAVEVSAALAPVKSAVVLYNTLMCWQRLDILGAMKPADSFAEFLSTQCVTGIKVEMNKKTGQWEIVPDESIAISAYDYYKSLYSIELPIYEDMACIFADDAYSMVIKSRGEGDSGELKIVKDNSLHQSFSTVRDRYKLDPIETEKLSWNALSRQLNKVADIMSFGYTTANEIKLINCDCKYVGIGLIGTKNKANQSGGFVVRKSSTIIDLIFRAIYTRKNGDSYGTEIQSGAKNAAKTYKANSAMAESGKNAQFAKNVTPDAGPVKCPDTPKAKKGSKKSTKKEEAAQGGAGLAGSIILPEILHSAVAKSKNPDCKLPQDIHKALTQFEDFYTLTAQRNPERFLKAANEDYQKLCDELVAELVRRGVVSLEEVAE